MRQDKMVQVRDLERDVFLGFHRSDAVEFRLQRLHPAASMPVSSMQAAQ